MRYSLLGLAIAVGLPLAASPKAYPADLETIRDRGYLIVAVKDNRRPLGFINGEGQLVGLEIDIARRLAAALLGDPSAVELQPVTNRDRLRVVLEDEVDVTIAGVTMTPMRQRLVSFSVPYYLDGTGVVTRNPDIQSVADLSAGAIALLEGSEAVTTVHHLLPEATLVGVSSYRAALTILNNQQADAFAGDVSILAGWVQVYPSYRLLPDVLTAEPLAVVLPKGRQYESLRRSINQALTEWHDTGWLEERADYWGLP